VEIKHHLHAKKFDASQKAMIASRLMPFYSLAAKERQLSGLKQNQSETTVKEKVPERKKKSQARDEAGKAAGVSREHGGAASVLSFCDKTVCGCAREKA
jgi:hypothetical protein